MWEYTMLLGPVGDARQRAALDAELDRRAAQGWTYDRAQPYRRVETGGESVTELLVVLRRPRPWRPRPAARAQPPAAFV
ncbi:MAG TPA: hypothetical protein VM536_06740 [Chloroflexia bacterium]|nr:hypothetical protein [Chloroflexia bacterium]